jgi:hypothetical protein
MLKICGNNFLMLLTSSHTLAVFLSPCKYDHIFSNTLRTLVWNKCRPKIVVHGLFTHKHCSHCWFSSYDNLPNVSTPKRSQCCGVVLGPYSPIQEKHVCSLYIYLLICCRSTECPNTITVGSIFRKQLEHFIMGTIN